MAVRFAPHMEGLCEFGRAVFVVLAERTVVAVRSDLPNIIFAVDCNA